MKPFDLNKKIRVDSIVVQTDNGMWYRYEDVLIYDNGDALVICNTEENTFVLYKGNHIVRLEFKVAAIN